MKEEDPITPPKKKKKSARFNDAANETHVVESSYINEKTLEDGHLKPGKYDHKLKSKDADIPLTPEQELEQFKSNFKEKASMAYLADFLIRRDQEDLLEVSQSTAELHAVMFEDEERYSSDTLQPFKNKENVEVTLSADALEKILLSMLDK